MSNRFIISSSQRSGFSLIEVVLAIGIFLVTVLALVGLLGPTLQSVDEVEKTDEVASIVNTVNAFLHNSPAIADGSNFETIFKAVENGTNNAATVFVYKGYRDNSEAVELKIGFDTNVALPDAPAGLTPDTDATIIEADLADAAGTIYRVVLTPSSVLPDAARSGTRSATTDTYSLSVDYASYLEGSFAMEVRIFAEAPGPTFTYGRDLAALKDEVPVFTYNTAVVR